MRSQTKATLLALAAVLCWSTVATAFELTLRRTDPVTMLLYSSFFSTLFLYGARRFRRSDPATEASRRPAGGGRRSGLLLSAVNGFLNPFLYYVVLFQAYDLLPAQEAQPLNYTWPIMIVLLSAPMLGQRIRPAGMLAILISFAGVLIISTGGDVIGLRFTHGPGALLAIGSSLIWAFYWLRNVRDRRGALDKLAHNFLFGTFYVLLLALVLGRDLRIDGAALAGCIYIGLFEMGVAFLFWLGALSLSESSARVSNLIFLSPFLSLFLIGTVVGERILPSSVIGLCVIVLGIWIQKKT